MGSQPSRLRTTPARCRSVMGGVRTSALMIGSMCRGWGDPLPKRARTRWRRLATCAGSPAGVRRVMSAASALSSSRGADPCGALLAGSAAGVTALGAGGGVAAPAPGISSARCSAWTAAAASAWLPALMAALALSAMSDSSSRRGVSRSVMEAICWANAASAARALGSQASALALGLPSRA